MSDARIRVQLRTTSAAATRRVAAALGRAARPPLVLVLEGDLGAGKTTFVQGLVQALDGGRDALVQSPTFALARTYETRPRVHHLDLYRVEDEESARALGLLELIADPDALSCVEWPAAVADALRDEDTGRVRIDAPSLRARAIAIDLPAARVEEPAALPEILVGAAAGRGAPHRA